MIVCRSYFIIVKRGISEESVQAGSEKIVKCEKKIEEFLLKLYNNSRYSNGVKYTMFGFD